jgi:hypothetical protein
MGIIGLIKKHINARLRSLETVEIVMVESVCLETMTCAVRPKSKVDVYGNAVEMPQILEVPIMLQKSGDSVIMMPPKAGDVGTCVFSKYALDNLLIDKSTVVVSIPRNFNINDAIYIGGNFVESETIPSVSEGEYLIHHSSGSTITISSSGNISLNHKSGAYIRIDSSGNISLYGRTITSTAWHP